MLKLKIQKADELDKNAKCTIHTSGKLGFSESGAKKMGLVQDTFVVIATNDEDVQDENLYAWLESNKDSGGFKVCKSGDYFYLNTKALFDKLQIDYQNSSQAKIYDIIVIEHEGQEIFKFLKRKTLKTRKPKNKTVEPDD